MKKLIFSLITIVTLSFFIIGADSPYARRIRPMASHAGACAENEIGYDMTDHNLYICKNTGWSLTGSGGGGTVTGSGTADQVALWSSSSAITGNAGLTFSGGGATFDLTVGRNFIGNLVGTASLNELPLTFSSPLVRTTNTISCPTCLIANQTITLSGDITGSGTTSIITTIASGVIVNADINASAAIAYSKLNLTGAVLNADLAGSIANAKLTNSTISGISLGSNLATLTIGTGLSGTSYNGSAGVTIALNAASSNLTDAANIPLLNASNTFTGALQIFPAARINGTGGNGYLSLIDQSSNPSALAGYNRIFSDSTNRFSFIGTNGFAVTLDSIGNTAARVYTFPDAAGTFLLEAATQTVTNKTITDSTNDVTAKHISVVSTLVGISPLEGDIRYRTGGSPAHTYWGSNANGSWVQFWTSGDIATIASGGTGTGSTLVGLIRGSASAFTAAELSGDVSTSGSNVVTIGNNKITGAMIAMGSDASGDILYYNGTDYVRLVKGTDGQILTLASGLPSWATGSGGGASTALDNLASVNINSILLAQTGIDLGSITKPFRNLFLYGAGTYGTNYFQITGTPTGTRVLTLPDITDTLVGKTTTDIFSNKSFSSAGFGIAGSTSGTTTITTDPIAGAAAVIIPAIPARLPVALLITNCTKDGNCTTQADTTGTGGNQNTASGTNGTSELIFTAPAPLPANYLTAGRAIRVCGDFSLTTGAVVPNITLRLKMGSTNVFATQAQGPAINIAGYGLRRCWIIQGTAAAGASVGVETSGNEAAFTSGVATLNQISQPVNIATNATQVISISMQWSANTSGNNVILRQFTIEAMN